MRPGLEESLGACVRCKEGRVGQGGKRAEVEDETVAALRCEGKKRRVRLAQQKHVHGRQGNTQKSRSPLQHPREDDLGDLHARADVDVDDTLHLLLGTELERNGHCVAYTDVVDQHSDFAAWQRLDGFFQRGVRSFIGVQEVDGMDARLGLCRSGAPKG